MTIPTNFTLEEVLKYADMDEKTRNRLYEVLRQVNEKEKEIKSLNRRIEVVEEQWHFCQDYIELVVEATKTTTKHKDLVKVINSELENSYIEL